MGHAGGVGRVFFGVLVGRVGGDLWGDVVADSLGDSIGIVEQRAELVIKSFKNVA